MATTEPVPDEAERIGNLGVWAVGAAGGFFLTFWLGLIVLLGGIGPELGGRGPDLGLDEATEPMATDTVTVTASEFAFQPLPAQVQSGELTFVLRNMGVVFHNLELLTPTGEPVSNFLLETEASQQASGSANLSPGRYLLICSVPGHREAGMEAVLTVIG